ncbi:hypothetical protein ThimaDRAFT_0832 [Thiocapsa marina 5811]|uniref:DUF4258 domain-containing protein n=1 Tax=Thiocapsa marina 5811 TaxID=768671 RepID=F9U7D0_9GAMM|nr:hypothetical protein ThimaDRAFT_0832 [Thiocapsa marina 5811]
MVGNEIYDSSLTGLTRHCEERSRQRGFTNSDIALVCLYGTPVADGYLVTREDLPEMLESSIGRPRAERLLGAVVIEQTGKLVTIFRSNKTWRRQATGRDKGGRRNLKAYWNDLKRNAA